MNRSGRARLGRITALFMAVWLVLTVTAWISGCTQDDLLVGPPVTDSSGALIVVSDPASATTAPRNLASLMTTPVGALKTVYVSLPLETVPDGVAATIRNRRTGMATTAFVGAGGFDPVPIEAAEGDSLDVAVQRSGADPLLLTMAVPVRRRPIIVRTDPAPRKRDVALNSRILIVFSEPMDSTALSPALLQLRGGGGTVAGRLEFTDAAHLVVAFTPSALLQAGTAYQLVPSPAIRDLDGDSLEQPPVSVEFVSGWSGVVMSRIAFTRDGIGTQSLIVMNADGSAPTMVSGSLAEEPAWSPDGTRLAFVSRRHIGDNAIYVMNAGGSGVARLTNYAGPEASPAWSPDGARIAFVRSGRCLNADCTSKGSGQLHVMNANGSGVRSLTNDPGSEGDPSWSPDGTRIAFVRESDIYVIDVNGGPEQRLTNDQRSRSPAWSPDGARIALARKDQVGNLDIYVMNADGSGLTRLTTDPAEDASPSWSPDGTSIAFQSGRTGRWQVFVMNADGSAARALTDDAGGRNPDWSRSGFVPGPPVLSVEMAPTASGDDQTDTVRSTLANPLRVRVLHGGVPAAGVVVSWSVEPGGGSVSAATTTTDAAGIASVIRTLGDTSGRWPSHALLSWTTARVTGAAGSPVVFSATARPGQATRLYGPQYEAIGAVNTVVEVVRAHAQDAYGNAVGGVPIEWAITAGGGSITPAPYPGTPSRPGLDTTAEDGYAWAEFMLGPSEGINAATAAAPTIPGSPAVTYQMSAVTALVLLSTEGAMPPERGFLPATVTVPPGKSVGWTSWDESTLHDVTFEDDPTPPASSLPFLGYAAFHMRTFTGAARIIRYRCTFHSTDFTHGEVGIVSVQ